jgi:predicted  nucleic acid-binding Zn-ribbon protein
MSIATDITGSPVGGSITQLVELLANPDAYAAKLKVLQDATAEYKKYVELYGVAADIESLRNQAKGLRSEAEAYKDSAIAKADSDLNAAQAKATTVIVNAEQQAASLRIDAEAVKAQADDFLSQAKAQLTQVKAAQARAEAAQAAAEVERRKAVEAQAQLDTTLAEAQVMKDSLIAKQKAFQALVQGL